MKRNLCGFAIAGPFFARFGCVAAGLCAKTRRHSEDVAFQQSGQHVRVKGMTPIVNSIFNGSRFEDVWLDH